ncbi:MAG: hypothetical protein SF182_19475, partial [Deltaproteobacteria bacterium]|nr:hypothetical protein [Deltaproteobacteria bacterium]
MRCARRAPRAALATVTVALLSGCAGFTQTVGGWFGSAPEPTPTRAAAAAPAGETFYAGAAGVTVYEQPSSSARVAGRLALHEKVTRAGVEHGYAHIIASTSGVTGWVDNAQLIWRLPGAPAASAPGS